MYMYMFCGGGGGSGLTADRRPVDPYIRERYERRKHLGMTNYCSIRLLSDVGAML